MKVLIGKKMKIIISVLTIIALIALIIYYFSTRSKKLYEKILNDRNISRIELSYGGFDSEIIEITDIESINSLYTYLDTSSEASSKTIIRNVDSYVFRSKLYLDNGAEVLLINYVDRYQKKVFTKLYFSRNMYFYYRLVGSDLVYWCNLYNASSNKFVNFSIPGIKKEDK